MLAGNVHGMQTRTQTIRVVFVEEEEPRTLNNNDRREIDLCEQALKYMTSVIRKADTGRRLSPAEMNSCASDILKDHKENLINTSLENLLEVKNSFENLFVHFKNINTARAKDYVKDFDIQLKFLEQWIEKKRCDSVTQMFCAVCDAEPFNA